jgi:hypothetical protein
MKEEQTTNYSEVLYVSSFEELVNTSFIGKVNAICWKRQLDGDFEEIVSQIELEENMVELNEKALLKLNLSAKGLLAREVILNDLQLLKAHGALPCLNVIKCYERDEEKAIISTDVYSFHVDSSPVPIDTLLCTYYGEPSDILPNEQAVQKVLIPSIREELKKQYAKDDNGFELYLSENCYDLHYQAKTNAKPISLGIGNLWRLATLHPESKVLPCIHRAPMEKEGQLRLMMIC